MEEYWKLTSVRINKANQSVAGAGFLIADRHIMTCAHVIAYALGIPLDTQEQPEGEVNLVFAAINLKKIYKSKIVKWYPVTSNQRIRDIAVLKLIDKPPKTATPVSVISSKNRKLWEHKFVALGFTQTIPRGEFARGEILELVGDNLIQIEGTRKTGGRIEPGFSGTAIWDLELKGIVGMAAREDVKRPDSKVAFMIPTETLLEAWSDLAKLYLDILAEGIELELLEIPGGSFWMGAPNDELKSNDRERPRHKVNISSFFMGRYPITQAQWQVVAQWNPIERELNPDPSEFKKSYQGKTRWTRPVECVSWEEAKEFCNRLTKRTGRKYRLPTEAEWEYACRAGTTTPFHFGETLITNTNDFANYKSDHPYGNDIASDYLSETTPVGHFRVPNNFGLYDMHGNVWEWCEDDWHYNYEKAPTNGSAWLSSNKNSEKVLRGGSYHSYPWFCRSAARNHKMRGYRNENYGFRVVRDSIGEVNRQMSMWE